MERFLNSCILYLTLLLRFLFCYVRLTVYFRANNFCLLVFVLVVSNIVVNVHINSFHTNLTDAY